jgi:predicted DsbA family dithiol-disulfide isomerase
VVGLRALETALARLDGEVTADIHLQPFELNPDMAPEGENTAEHVQKKYGSSSQRSQGVRQALQQSGEALGFTFNYRPESRIWNSFDAHRLLHWAEEAGKGLALKQALFKANFTEQRDISDHQVLADAAAGVGLDRARAEAILASDEFAEAVRADEELWRSRGIQAVPSLIINQRWLIQGAQSPDVFEQTLRQIVNGTAQAAR